MAVAPTQGYERGMPQGTAAQPGASAEAFGADVGAAMSRFGQQLHHDDIQLKELELRRQRDSAAAQAGLGLVQLDTEANAWARDAQANRRNEQGEALGHTAAGLQEFDRRAETYLSSITDPTVREHYQVRVAELRGRFEDQQSAWERGQRAGVQARNVEEAVSLRAANIATRPFSMAELEQAATDTNADLDLQETIAPEVRDQARQQFTRQLALAAIDAGTRQNPQAMQTLIEGGAFNRFGITAEDIRQRGNMAGAAAHALETEARQAQAAQREQFNQDMQVLDRRFADGDPSITLDEVTAMGQRAAALGVRPEAYDAARYQVRLQIMHRYRTTNAVGLRQVLGELDSRINAAGDHARPEDAIARTQVEQMLERRLRLEQSDPLRVSGAAYAPIDGTPASIRARVGAARTAERETGHFQFYTPQELPRLQELAASGPAGRLQAANEVAAIGAVDPRAGDAAARQILPNDATFRIAARLNPTIRAQVLRGADARRQMPQQLTLADGSHRSFDDVTQRWFQANIAPQLRALNPEDANGVLEAARSAYAERARAHGNLASTGFDQGTFGEAVSDVLGRTAAGGGTGYWDFGSNGQIVTSGRRPGIVLPLRMTQARLDRVMTWMPIARLGEREWPPGSAPNGGPRFGRADGPIPSVDDIRGRYVPVMVNDGVYEFHASDGTLLSSQSGAPFRLNVYALEAHGAPRRPLPPPDPALQRQLDAGRREYDRRRQQAGN